MKERKLLEDLEGEIYKPWVCAIQELFDFYKVDIKSSIDLRDSIEFNNAMKKVSSDIDFPSICRNILLALLRFSTVRNFSWQYNNSGAMNYMISTAAWNAAGYASEMRKKLQFEYSNSLYNSEFVRFVSIVGGEHCTLRGIDIVRYFILRDLKWKNKILDRSEQYQLDIFLRNEYNL